MDDLDFASLRADIERLLGLDLSGYKPKQMRRRLDTFIQRNGGSARVFLDRVRTDRALLAALRDMLTINVTEFYRDPAQWTHLRDAILPPLLQRRPRLRCWSAGCSTGAEPYTIAMLLEERNLTAPRIIATDFDRAVLQRARAGGPYPATETRHLPALFRQRYLTLAGPDLLVTPNVRRRVEFRELNLLRDPFPGPYDLILCRNVVIYFEERIKRALFERLFGALAPGGILFIGATESILNPESLGLQRLGGNFYLRPDPAATRPAA